MDRVVAKLLNSSKQDRDNFSTFLHDYFNSDDEGEVLSIEESDGEEDSASEDAERLSNGVNGRDQGMERVGDNIQSLCVTGNSSCDDYELEEFRLASAFRYVKWIL
jgi:hypothetical protein